MGQTREKKLSNRNLKSQQKQQTGGELVPELPSQTQPAIVLSHIKHASTPNGLPRKSHRPFPSSVKDFISSKRVDTSLIQVHDFGPGKGLGLVATRKIEPGTLVLEEEPVIRLTEEEERDSSQLHDLLQSRYQCLTDIDKAEFRNLHDTKKTDFSPRQSIYWSNDYNLKAPRSQYGGSCLGLKASRINHSCTPNVQFSFMEPESLTSSSAADPVSAESASEGDDASSVTSIDHDDAGAPQNCKNGVMRFYAIRPIKRGGEIVSNYDSAYLTSEQRQLNQRVYYGFQCDCSVCRPDTDGNAISDGRRKKMIRYRHMVKDAEQRWRARAIDAHPRRQLEVTSKLDSEHTMAHAAYTASSPNISLSSMKPEISSIIETLECLVDLLKREGLNGVELADVYSKLAKWSERADDMDAVEEWLKKEHATCIIAFGADSRRVKKVEERLDLLERSDKGKVKV
ncbi:hypothetical protein PMZ80_010127 [Knufia obscura]|uniref:SET domain-containing protein n=1 Tax=Knufia obscura TaxID=1635080 RepID=A0ABR0RB76_9EURO|nr:hypothetical protein PMZ80_010127 [Knufia obscura]